MSSERDRQLEVCARVVLAVDCARESCSFEEQTVRLPWQSLFCMLLWYVAVGRKFRARVRHFHRNLESSGSATVVCKSEHLNTFQSRIQTVGYVASP